MATQTHEGRAVLTEKINGQLGSFVNSMEIAIRNNLPNRNVLAETTLKGLLNRIHGWDLVNANSICQNYPGIDLIDTGRRIGVQVTSTNTAEKVKHTLEQVEKLPPEDQVDQLYILTITKDAPTEAMKKRTLGTCFSGEKHIWNIPELLRQMMDLDVSKLEDIHAYLNTELGTLHQKMEQPHLLLRPVSAIGSGFVGREGELAEIQRRVDAGEKLIVLSGLGGIGKTELAVRFGRDYKGGAVYFTRFQDSFTHTLAEMAYGIRPKLSRDVLSLPDEDLRDMVLGILETCGKNDILIIDNVDSDKGSLYSLMNDSGFDDLMKLDLRLILTTRFDYDRSLIGIQSLAYRELFQIFTNHGANIPETDKKALIEAVNGHTLTIDLIARTLNGKSWRKVTPETLLTDLRTNALPGANYRKITSDYNQSEDQAQIYQHLSVVFDATGVPEDGKAVLRFATLLPEGGMNGEYFHQALTELQQQAFETLIEHGWLNAEDGLLTIHPVIRLVCREELKPNEDSCGKFLIALSAQYDNQEFVLHRFAQMAELFSLAADNTTDSIGLFAYYAGGFWKLIGQYSKALPYALQAVARCGSSSCEISEKLAATYDNLGSIQDKLGHHEDALQNKRKAVSILEEMQTPNPVFMATAYNDLGCTYFSLKKYTESLMYLQKGLDIRVKIFSDDHPDIAQSHNNFGATYCAMGHYGKALRHYLIALRMRKKQLKENHPDIAQSICNVGFAYAHIGDLSRALECLTKGLAMYEKSLFPEHPDVINARQGIDEIKEKLKQEQNARTTLKFHTLIVTSNRK